MVSCWVLTLMIAGDDDDVEVWCDVVRAVEAAIRGLRACARRTAQYCWGRIGEWCCRAGSSVGVVVEREEAVPAEEELAGRGVDAGQGDPLARADVVQGVVDHRELSSLSAVARCRTSRSSPPLVEPAGDGSFGVRPRERIAGVKTTTDTSNSMWP